MTKRSKALRERAAVAQHHSCYYCGFPMWQGDVADFASRFAIRKRAALRFQCTAEHVSALGDGGTTTTGNIVAACHYCNQMRHRRNGRISSETFLALVRRRVGKHAWHPVQFYKLIAVNSARTQ